MHEAILLRRAVRRSNLSLVHQSCSPPQDARFSAASPPWFEFPADQFRRRRQKTRRKTRMNDWSVRSFVRSSRAETFGARSWVPPVAGCRPSDGSSSRRRRRRSPRFSRTTFSTSSSCPGSTRRWSTSGERRAPRRAGQGRCLGCCFCFLTRVLARTLQEHERRGRSLQEADERSEGVFSGVRGAHRRRQP